MQASQVDRGVSVHYAGMGEQLDIFAAWVGNDLLPERQGIGIRLNSFSEFPYRELSDKI